MSFTDNEENIVPSMDESVAKRTLKMEIGKVGKFKLI